MFAFALVLTIAVITFSITFDILLKNGQEEAGTFVGSLNHIFLLMQGDF